METLPKKIQSNAQIHKNKTNLAKRLDKCRQIMPKHLWANKKCGWTVRIKILNKNPMQWLHMSKVMRNAIFRVSVTSLGTDVTVGDIYSECC